MGLERLESYDEAMKELLRPQWLSGIMDSRKKEQTLKTVLEHSRRSYFLDKFEEEPVLCQHLTWMLRDKMAYTYVTTIQTLRILRNACARREKNQMQCELTGAQNGVINTLVMLIPTNSGSESSAHADLALKRIKSTNFRLRNEYVLYGIQFLCNFCTGNVTKDNGVWDSLSPEIFEELFKLPDDNIFAATAALFHNCIASKPTRMHAILNSLSLTELESVNVPSKLDDLDNVLEALSDRAKQVVTFCRLALGAGTVDRVMRVMDMRDGVANTRTSQLLCAFELATLQIIQQKESQKKPWSSLTSGDSVLAFVEVLDGKNVDLELCRIVLHILVHMYAAGVDVVPESVAKGLQERTMSTLLVLLREMVSANLHMAVLLFLEEVNKREEDVLPSVNVTLEMMQNLFLKLKDTDSTVASSAASIIKALTKSNAANQIHVNTIFESIETPDLILLDNHGLSRFDIQVTSRKLNF